MSDDFKLKALLHCGTGVEIVQPGQSQTLELTITPPEGKKIEETAWIKDNNLRVNATIHALAGLYQMLGLIFRPARNRKQENKIFLFGALNYVSGIFITFWYVHSGMTIGVILAALLTGMMATYLSKKVGKS